MRLYAGTYVCGNATGSGSFVADERILRRFIRHGMTSVPVREGVDSIERSLLQPVSEQT